MTNLTSRFPVKKEVDISGSERGDMVSKAEATDTLKIEEGS